jgi:CRISPR-associated protein Cas5h
MQGITFQLSGNYGHFKQPQTNNNPCTFSIMHKVAAMGFVGAVLGIDRASMISLFPQLCEDLIYSVKLLTPILKESHAFTKKYAMAHRFFESGQRFCEYLRNPSYEITIGLRNERSKGLFDKFCVYLQNDQATYPTYFGSVNCPATYVYKSMVEISDPLEGEFETDSIISDLHTLLEDNDFVSERIPTNQPQKMLYDGWVLVVCVQGVSTKTKGTYQLIDKERAVWFM